ncbi:hypothetical protein [Paraburkholderia lacunae]|uniref:Uncharacterized protein n=1 Tax=Paraburkholderia lacunae TaxID=2211104 RepID=A0A370NFW9_9BURK|nr:hypothetical protein [Paraburkholderia lacunae]RDK04480.1 hypothetical protein DLM46_00980 [Paraburkholderia lacunae]
MDHLLGEGVLGIVTGILTTAILFTLRALWTSKLSPLIEALRYRGLKVDGVWEGRHKDDKSQSESRLSLKQRAHTMSGTFTFKYLGPDKEFTLDFDVTGVIWEGYLTLNFFPNDRRITSCATSLVKIRGGGSNMVGAFLFRNAEVEDVGVVPFNLRRYERVAGFNATGNAAPRAAELGATQAVHNTEEAAQPAAEQRD